MEKVTTITVQVNPKVFARAVKEAKQLRGKFNPDSKTWTLSAPHVHIAVGSEDRDEIKQWLGYRGLILV